MKILLITIILFSYISIECLGQSNENKTYNTNDATSIILWQSLGAIGGGVLGGLCGLGVGAGISSIINTVGNNDEVLIIPSMILFTAGVPFGVYLVSTLCGFNGSYWCSLIGSAVGMTATVGVFIVHSGLYFLFFILPVVGAIIGYDISIQNDKRTSLFNIKNDKLGINIPSIGYNSFGINIGIIRYEY